MTAPMRGIRLATGNFWNYHPPPRPPFYCPNWSWSTSEWLPIHDWTPKIPTWSHFQRKKQTAFIGAGQSGSFWFQSVWGDEETDVRHHGRPTRIIDQSLQHVLSLGLAAVMHEKHKITFSILGLPQTYLECTRLNAMKRKHSSGNINELVSRQWQGWARRDPPTGIK